MLPQKMLKTSVLRLVECISNILDTAILNLKTVHCTRSKIRDLEETLRITVQNESIYRAPFVKSLGLFIDKNLDWGDHASHVLKKVSSGLSILKMSKNYFLKELQKSYTTL